MSKSIADVKQGGLYTKTDKGEFQRVGGTEPGGMGKSAAANQKPRKAKAKAKAPAKAKAAPASESVK